MKKVLAILLVLAAMVSLCSAAFADRLIQPMPCVVNDADVNERSGPKANTEIVRVHPYRDIVYVIDTTNEEWWKLSNGNYMFSKYLTPISEEEVWEYEIAGYFDGLAYGEQVEMTEPRMMAFMYMNANTDMEWLAQTYQNFVLFNVSAQTLECYRDGEQAVCIQLKASPYKFTTSVSYYGETAYDVYSVQKVMEIVYRYSTNYTYFIVLP